MYSGSEMLDKPRKYICSMLNQPHVLRLKIDYIRNFKNSSLIFYLLHFLNF